MNNTFFHVGLVKFLLFNIADSIVQYGFVFIDYSWQIWLLG